MKFIDTEPDTSIEAIKQIETNHGIQFPSEYVRHILKYNGGSCSPDTFSFMEDGEKAESQIDYFHAVNSGDDYDLSRCIQDLNGEGRLNKYLIPIATDPLGNFVLISCRESDFGKIYFWDHENEFDNSYQPAYLSDTLNEFLNSLYS
ncbi:SMI1/KNR4 family protein [Neolewinella lacunae]|uniref:SMI1/KNR4 family protein n=1 Tax=Neolewinella lacunae TaxID=1517758 RepID=A0A923PEK9_9BACT|nr:SMI1/KNR4 family protein [Neolewinella lacunae]MBC6992627.1 SMI1/KNR4 family protein [Neolewinella lacunae]MDN3633680.1 SMI1/KNR4 family protein [Neolewinella lacunae]